MTRKEYMDLLSRALENVEPEVARDIMEDYEAHFERANESGKSDEEVIEELGSIEEFKEELAAFITGKNSGEKKSVETEAAAKNGRTESGGEEAKSTADTLEEDVPQEEEVQKEDSGWEDRQKEQIKYQQQVEEELNRARNEMNRAYEEMMRRVFGA